MTDARRAIPGVDALLESSAFAALLERYPRHRVVGATRAALDDVRSSVAEGADPSDLAEPGPYASDVAERLARAEVPSLRRVINATGVVLHTNLGRAPLAPAAIEAMRLAAAGYTNLEYDLDAGERGSRYAHCAGLLTELTGAEDALVVNNNAAALVLALSTVAGGRGVAVSRGELVEIGGGFRIPEILARSGAKLEEVGSTNRTRVTDYTEAFASADVAAVLKVHRSNFRISGFTEEASLVELRGATLQAGVPLLYDLGSGLFADPASLGLPPEPRAAEALAAGVDIVMVSGDKLLGGPQAGIVLGRAELVRRLRENPLCRALRVDKVTLAGLEATLRLYRDPPAALREIPVLRMISADAAELESRARGLCERLAAGGAACDVARGSGAVGGGTYPEVELATWTVRVEGEPSTSALAAALRAGEPPVVGRAEGDRLVIDVRTVLEGEEDMLVAGLLSALEKSAGA